MGSPTSIAALGVLATAVAASPPRLASWWWRGRTARALRQRAMLGADLGALCAVPVAGSAITALIDTVPMRRAEMRRR